MKLPLTVTLLLIQVFALSQEFNITPTPVSLKSGTGFFTIPQPIRISSDKGAAAAADFLAAYLNKYYGSRSVQTAAGGPQKETGSISLRSTRGEKGAYTLKIDKNGITISGDEAGTFYGIQTLIQLLPLKDPKSGVPDSKLQIPAVTVTDYPRFAYRGMHLDVARHFFPVTFVKKYIDYLALHKFNYFHWHLTDDQGWRIEIKKYPKLIQTGAWRNGTIIGRYPGTGNDNERYGGFYTQAEVKDIVQYAAQRHITVVPEIEMPGHASAAIASYPWLSCFPAEKTVIPSKFPSNKSKAATGKLVQETWGVFDDVFCAGKDSTFTFLQDVLEEVLPLFPSKYIHVGGDESPKTSWKRCPLCQQRIKDNHLKDEHELQSYFIQRMEKYLNRKGRTLIGWDEILEGGLAPNAMVMSWRGEEGGIAAAKQGHPVIMTPGGYVYFDHTQSEKEDSVTIGGYTPLDKVYTYEPVPAALNAEEAKYVFGAQANLWTEYIAYPSKVEYMIFPRMAALSEVLWSPKEVRNWADFEKRLPGIFSRYDFWGTNYSRAYYNLSLNITSSPDFDAVIVHAKSTVPEGIIKYSNGKENTASNGEASVIITSSGNYTFSLYNGEKLVNSTEQRFLFNKATGKKITLTTQPSKNYPGNGAFTLVDGIQNTKGLNASREFLGFNGKDLEAVIDLGSVQEISHIKLHLFEQPGSWIYLPVNVQYFISTDGQSFQSLGSGTFGKSGESDDFNEIKVNAIKAKYVKVVAQNTTKIAEGQPGAGNPAWLFADEVEVQ